MNQIRDSAVRELARRELARRRYGEYLAYAHGDGWIPTRMSEFIADEVQAFIETDTGHAYDVLVVNCPPQHGKSMTITESLPSWYLGKYPTHNVIVASYDSDFAERFCRKNKDKIRDVGKRLFGIEIGAIDRSAEFVLAPRLAPETGAERYKRSNTSSAVSDMAQGTGTDGSCCRVAAMDTGSRNVANGLVLADRASAMETGNENVTNRTVPTDTLRAGGRLIARGIMSGITGNPGNLIIIDDPVKNQLEADSPTYRQRLWGEWQASIKSRLAAHAKVIVIMTPWREDCFDREVLRTEANVRHISLPVEAGEDDPLGRKPGEALCPELGKDDRWLAEFRESYIHDPLGGQRAWAAMYLCSPRVEDGNLIRREWWKYYRDRGRAGRLEGCGATMVPVAQKLTASVASDGGVCGTVPSTVSDGDSSRSHLFGDRLSTVPTDTLIGTAGRIENVASGNVFVDNVTNGTVPVDTEPEAYGTEVISVDAAFKDADNNDFVSIQVWGKRGADYYLRYCVNEHLDFPRTVQKIRDTARLYPNARLVLIEQAANGAAIISVLQKELNVIPVTPQGGKVSRVNAVAPVIESGHVYLPDPEIHPWVAEYVNQWTVFPNGKHDDMVDASTQALSRLFMCTGEVWTEETAGNGNSGILLENMYETYTRTPNF